MLFVKYFRRLEFRKYYRTTVPKKVREVLKLDMGDEIVWVKEGEKIMNRKC